MNHTLNLLDDSVRRLLGDTVSPARTIAAQKQGLDRPTWDGLRQLGVVGADAATMSLPELAVVTEAVAAAGALVPYADSEALGRWLASAAELAVEADMLTVAVVPATAVVQVDAAGLRLSVPGLSIPWGCRADQVLFSLRDGERHLVAAKALREIELRRMPSLASEPHGIVQDAQIFIAAQDLREVSAGYGPQAVQQRGALARAIQMLGALTQTNALTLQYARDRKQFKRALSDFQVIQSYLAAMAGELCAASGMVQIAIDAQHGEEAGEAIAAAKVRVGQAARQITQLGHQVHGAIGFTEEYPLNLWTRRLWAWREEYGNEAWWAEELGRQYIARGADALWPHLSKATEVAHG